MIYFRVSKAIEGGLMDKYKIRHWPRSQCRGQGTYAEVSQVKLHSLMMFLSVLTAGIGLAVIVLLLESSLLPALTKKRKPDPQ